MGWGPFNPKAAFTWWSCMVVHIKQCMALLVNISLLRETPGGISYELNSWISLLAFDPDFVTVVHLNPKPWIFSPGQAEFLISEILIHLWYFTSGSWEQAGFISVTLGKMNQLWAMEDFCLYENLDLWDKSSFIGLWRRRWLIGFLVCLRV